MLWQRDTETERLLNIIQVLQLGQKTGLLSVERRHGDVFEEGMITFVSGKIEQVWASHLQGAEAFAWLSSWGKCMFAFIPTSKEQFTLPATPDGRPVTTPLPVILPSPVEAHRRRINDEDEEDTRPSITVHHIVPKRRGFQENSLSMTDELKFSRLHKHIFLLINGQRTLTDIVRLVRQDQRTVYQMLRDLEKAGVIDL